MDIIIVETYDELSAKAAEIVTSAVKQADRVVLGLPTGSTPEGMYARLVEMYREKMVDFRHVTTFNLDEYYGLSTDHPQSYHYYMRYNFFDHVNVPGEQINLPRCGEGEAAKACREYEQKIAGAGGIDLQVLGVGVNGHIGFNEPGEYLRGETHLVDLSADTIEANSRFFTRLEEVPRQALTMGVASIMRARKILLLAAGKSKAEAIKKTVSGLITTKTPASLLQLHRDCILVADKEAAALCSKA